MQSLIYLTILLSGLTSIRTLAQPIADQLWLTKPIESGVLEKRQVLRFLWFTNRIGEQARVHYQAGQSVELLPGFETSRATKFEALIHPIPLQENNDLLAVVYPNPFTDHATISFQFPSTSDIELDLVNAHGHSLNYSSPLFLRRADHNHWTIEGNNLPTGVYLLSLKAGLLSRTIRLIKR